MSAEERIRQQIAAQVETDMYRAIYGVATTSTVTAEEKPFQVGKMLALWENIIRETRRTQVTFRVDLAHPGSMLKYETTDEGTVIEMSFVQAQQLHQKWPMRLHKILDTNSAEFTPVTPFDVFVPTILPMPPFVMQQETETES
ncbi:MULTISPECIES: hypothetical protein [unclassified Mesorhizobium]|uniref:hypothetical protein n=1 Tax=unclassified Mesorhizobium TaxID=325217 RepID=UPI0010936E2A|nr:MULTISPECIES: hypothetical protein [unclassified Mesorhizobium]TGT90879.1 hypothetical protein EN804_05960 [Mesorhizobium sp. M8A.F.Ca.ET.161.01.1.1]TGV43841.1 hypothetical protein EN785_07585 [Mesorhizobium sp. M8A.F.Ca.ET.142.01.1.1]